MTIEIHATKPEPDWIRALVNDVLVDAFQPLGFIGPLGYRVWHPGHLDNIFDGWQIAVYPVPNEVRGSHPHDGERFVNGFCLDVGQILRVITDLKSVAWNMPTSYNGELDGPELSLQGKFAGKQVWLRIFQMPPSDEPALYYIDPMTGKVQPKVNV
jgi:hypothetical protein